MANPEGPTGYEDEPREHFEPLPPHLHSTYYHYERASGNVRPEIAFYRSVFSGPCSRVVELGCGTSIIASELSRGGVHVTGLDRSPAMLQFHPRPIVDLVQMDMTRLGFRPGFDGAFIAHNTLNLLGDENLIRQCLAEIRRILVPPGLLALHLYSRDGDSRDDPDRNHLQFHLFDLPTGEKIVKESLTRLSPDRKRLHIEQRYKYRNFSRPERNRNYRQFLDLAAFTPREWLNIITESGFQPLATATGFSSSQNPSSSALIVTARAEL